MAKQDHEAEWPEKDIYGILDKTVSIARGRRVRHTRDRGDILNFIHTADIHLGAAPDSTMTWATDRSTEIWDTFYKLLDETERSGADLLLIAGDLFHRQPLKRELKELNYRFSQLTHA